MRHRPGAGGRRLTADQVQTIFIRVDDLLRNQPRLMRDEQTVRSLLLLYADTITSNSQVARRAAAGELRAVMRFIRRPGAGQARLVTTRMGSRSPDIVYDLGRGGRRLEITTVTGRHPAADLPGELWSAIHRKAFPSAPGFDTQLIARMDHQPGVRRAGSVGVFIPFPGGANVEQVARDVIERHARELVRARGLETVEIFTGPGGHFTFTQAEIHALIPR